MYVPGTCVEYEGEKNITQLFGALYDSVDFLRKLFCNFQVLDKDSPLDLRAVCATFLPDAPPEPPSKS